jgi:hypothetical protein
MLSEEDHDAWPAGEAGKDILVPFPAEKTKAWAITPRVNSLRNNDRSSGVGARFTPAHGLSHFSKCNVVPITLTGTILRSDFRIEATGAGILGAAGDGDRREQPWGGTQQWVSLPRYVLGMTEAKKPANLAKRGGLWLRTGNLEIHLGVDSDFRPAHKAHPAIAVSDIIAVANHLSDNRIDIAWDDNVPDRKRFYVHDNVGNRIEIVQATETEISNRVVRKQLAPPASRNWPPTVVNDRHSERCRDASLICRTGYCNSNARVLSGSQRRFRRGALFML